MKTAKSSSARIRPALLAAAIICMATTFSTTFATFGVQEAMAATPVVC